MKNIKRKGFTLVELLIVIVVIGILSAMMMLSSTEAVTSARASNIVSNLRNFKTAALAYYVDNLDSSVTTADWDSLKGTDSMDIVVKYMNNSSQQGTADSDLSKYGICNVNDRGWFVYYNFTANSGTKDTRIASKLAGRAKSVGLYGAASATALSADVSYAYTDQNICGMWVVKP